MGAPGTDKALTGIMRWSTRPEWQGRVDQVFDEHLGDVLDENGLSRDELVDLLGDDYLRFIGCSFEDLLTRCFEPDDANLVDDYLKRRGFKEGVPVKAYLRAVQDSVMGLYEVVETSPGSHFMVRNLIRGGEPIRVEDKLVSADLLRWDRLAMRVLSIRGKSYMSAGALPLGFDAATAILTVARRLTERLDQAVADLDEAAATEALADGSLPEVALDQLAPVITQMWLRSALDDALDQEFDRTIEGDPVVPTKVRFALVEPVDRDAIAARLDARPELARDDTGDDGWTWRGDLREGPTDSTSSEGFLLGWLRIEDGDLLLSTFSVQRGQRGVTLVTEAVGALVGEPRVEAATPPSGHEMAPPGGAPAAATTLEQSQLSLFPGGAEPSSRTTLDQHFREALTTRFSFLDDKTPRQAVRTEEDRHRVVDWLKSLENQEARHARETGEPPYDVTWMWEALKLNHLRR